MRDAPKEPESLNSSTPTTPLSGLEILPNSKMHRSGDDSWSPHVDDGPQSSPLEDSSDDSSPETFNSTPMLNNIIPAPYIPLRKDSLNRLQLIDSSSRTSPYQYDESPSPTPSPRLIGHRPSSPPRLPKDQQPTTPPPVPPPKAERGPPVPSKSDASPGGTPPRLPTRARGFTSTSRDLPPLPEVPQVKQQTSIPDLASIRRQLASSQYRPERGPNARYTNSSMRSTQQAALADEVRASYRSALNNGPYVNEGEIRSSVRSALTYGSAMTFASSSVHDASDAERSSVVTRASSFTDSLRKRQTTIDDEGLSVEDAISLYMHGFEEETELERQLDAGIDEVRDFVPPPPVERRESRRLRKEESLTDLLKPYTRPEELHKSPSLPDLPKSSSTFRNSSRSYSDRRPASRERIGEEHTTTTVA